MAAENQFTVDLGNIQLSDQQRTNINNAIHKAVAGELAGLGAAGKVVLVPVSKGKGPLINGIIVLLIDEKMFADIVNSKTIGH